MSKKQKTKRNLFYLSFFYGNIIEEYCRFILLESTVTVDEKQLVSEM
jgi:hypothetical protein